MTPKNKVQTRQTFEEWMRTSSIRLPSGKDCWNAALDSVILPEGKRFEVGDKVSAVTQADGVFRLAVISAVDKDNCQTRLPSNVRPLPQTVELTTEEKLKSCIEAIMDDMTGEQAYLRDDATFKLLEELANGKTLDELCQEYNVATTREV